MLNPAFQAKQLIAGWQNEYYLKQTEKRTYLCTNKPKMTDNLEKYTAKPDSDDKYIGLQERIELLAKLGDYLQSNDEQLQHCISISYAENRWFTPENIRKALNSISQSFLEKDKLISWTEHYKLADKPLVSKSVGLIMAGNIPLVGFHDVLCIFICGHKAVMKCSDKDKRLLPLMIEKLAEWNPNIREYFSFSEMLKEKDAYIATGSNNSARYFASYFDKYPNIIRKNRNAVAVLDGKESSEELIALGNDIFSYFGLGCRNVSKIYVPEGYDLTILLEVLHDSFKEAVTHDKYKNNFDYNYALYLLNKVKFLATGSLLLTEDNSLHSRIAALHYEFYSDIGLLEKSLIEMESEIQCIASHVQFSAIQTIPLGTTQQPGLFDYADGVDVIHFLQNL